MALTRTFTLIGTFDDRGIAKALEKIQKILDKQVSIIDDLNDRMGDLHSTLEQLNDANEEVNENIEQSSSRWRSFFNTIRDGVLEAEAIEKIAEGIQDGITGAVGKIADMAGNAVSFLKERFQAGVDDQISDIQAAGSLFGAMKTDSLLGENDYEKATKMAKTIEETIGKVLLDSNASTDKVTALARGLNDNLFPTLIKGGHTIESASKEMATLYEQAVFLTPEGQNIGVTGKVITKLLGGASENQMAQFAFFEQQTTFKNALKQMNFYEETDMAKKIKLLQKAFNAALPPESLAEMRGTISAGYQAIMEVFTSDIAGIFAFNRGLDGQTKAAAEQAGIDTEKYDTPLKIIGKTAAPFLHSLANLFSSAGPIMGHLAIIFDTYVGPILNQLTENLENLMSDVRGLKRSFPEALGRFSAEIVKHLTGGNAGGLMTKINEVVNNLMDQFSKGFNSLGTNINWDAVSESIARTIISVIVQPEAIKFFTALIGILAAPTIISAVVSATLPLILAQLKGFITGMIWPLLSKMVMAIITPIISMLGAIGAVPIAITALVALIGAAIYRYREGIGQALVSIKELILNGLAVKLIELENVFLKIVSAFNNLFSFLQDIPGVGKFFKGADDKKEENEGKIQELKDANTEVMANGFNTIIDQVSSDVQGVGNVANNIGEITGIGLGDITKKFETGNAHIQEMGSGVLTTNASIESVNDTVDKAANNANKAATNVGDGMNKINSSFKAINNTIKSLSSGGGGGGSGTSSGPTLSGGTLMGSAQVSRGGTGDIKGGNNPHTYNAVDYAVPVGTKIAPNEPYTIDKVVQGTPGGAPGYGDYVSGSIGGKSGVILAHLSKIYAKVGEVVKPGHIIGLSGGAAGAAGSGNSTGPHIHFEPGERAVADKFSIANAGMIPKHLLAMGEALRMEMANSPRNANPVIANDSEAILTRNQASAINNTILNYQRMNGSGSDSNISVNVEFKALDSSALTEEQAVRYGRMIASGFNAQMSDSMKTSTLSSVGV